MARKLTPIAVEKTRPHPSKRREIPDAGKPGLYLVVQPSGRKSWAVRYRHQGRPRKLTLDGFSSLVTARKLAQAALDRAAEGFDPASEKRSARHALAAGESDLFRDVASQYLERYVRRNTRPSSAHETERLLNKEILPKWGNKRVQEISRRHVLDLLDGIVDRGGHGRRGLTANRALSVVRKLFNWALQRGIVDASPVAGVKPPVSERSRDRVLTDDEVRWLWKAAEKAGYPFGHLTQLLLLTGQRRREVAGMSYAELDLGNRSWTIPGQRTKNDERHEVPLSDPTFAVIESLPRIRSRQDFLFTTNGTSHVSGYSRAKSSIDKTMLAVAREEAEQQGDDPARAGIPRWTFHDLRRTTASGMARLGISLPVIEKVLNHSSGSFAGIVGVYQRHSYGEEKREAIEAWGAFVWALVQPKPAAKVLVPRKAS